jgi:hypothetical protein
LDKNLPEIRKVPLVAITLADSLFGNVDILRESGILLSADASQMLKALK